MTQPEHAQLLAVAILIALVVILLVTGFAIGLLTGRRIWGPKWFGTSEGIDQRFRRMKF